MDRKIGIIAPFVNEQFNADFALRLNNGIELTFKNILTIIKNNYDTDQTLKRIPDGINKFSAAGYYLSGFLRSHGFDTFLSAGEDEEALRKVASANPFAICISTSLINSKKFLKQLVNKVRSIMPEIPIIVGGILVWKSYLWYTKYSEENNSHPHHYRENQLCSEFLFPTTKTELDVDVFVISPDGCPTLLKVLQEFEKGRRADLSELPNLGLPARDGRFLLNPIIVEEIDQDSIITRWDLLDTLPMQIPIRTSIGCPYRCAYCDFCQLIPKVFFRPVDSLKKELDLLNRISSTGYHPTTNLFLTDDNVFCNEKRIAEVCNTIQESGLSKPWLGFLRASSINQSNIKMIKDSGLFCALVGIESGDKTQLHRMNRKQDVIQMKTGLEILDAAAICSIISLVIGFPGET
ncbi:MAG: radical SAM protein, partial [Chitinispirillia bacterium]